MEGTAVTGMHFLRMEDPGDFLISVLIFRGRLKCNCMIFQVNCATLLIFTARKTDGSPMHLKT